MCCPLRANIAVSIHLWQFARLYFCPLWTFLQSLPSVKDSISVIYKCLMCQQWRTAGLRVWRGSNGKDATAITLQQLLNTKSEIFSSKTKLQFCRHSAEMAQCFLTKKERIWKWDQYVVWRNRRKPRWGKSQNVRNLPIDKASSTEGQFSFRLLKEGKTMGTKW